MKQEIVRLDIDRIINLERAIHVRQGVHHVDGNTFLFIQTRLEIQVLYTAKQLPMAIE